MEEFFEEDGEEKMVVDIFEFEVIELGFDIRIKNYRIFEGMGVIFYCKMFGYSLFKVKYKYLWKYVFIL